MKGLDFLTSLRGYDARAVSLSTAVDTGEETSVQQQFADEVDINTILRRFGVTHGMPSGLDGGVYGDFTGITDFESAVAAIERAQAGFMTLDPQVREKFGNDPGKYLAHVSALSDEELGPEVGLRAPEAPKPPEPQRVIVVEDPASEGSSSAATRVGGESFSRDVSDAADRQVRRSRRDRDRDRR